MADYSYIGVGKIYLRDRSNVAAGLIEIGNCSSLSFKVDEEIKEQQDFRNVGGGVLNEVRRIKGVAIDMSLEELTPANLARALYGSASAVSAGTVAAGDPETVTARKGALVKLAHANPSTVVVKSEGGSITYEAGSDKDYEVRTGGIYITPDSDIVDGSTLTVTYSYGAQNVIQALVSSSKEYELFFEGLNEARTGSPVNVEAWRCKLGALADLALLGSDYASLKVTGKVLKDTTQAAGISQYFRATIVE
ncbi:MAG: ferrichrome ABC transporter ATP-binding protein [Deltaproteobacteria bacterium]|nr:ferrichrome ABC transporter ATP-binding protein [Deltaproteobacteria bacterium]